MNASTRRLLRGIVPMGIGAMLLAGCQSSANPAMPGPAQFKSVQDLHSAPAMSTISKDGVTVTLRLERTWVVRGGTLKTTLTIDNESTQPVPLPCMINGAFGVQLENKQYQARFIHTLVGCTAVEHLKKGRTVFKEPATAIFNTCTIDPASVSDDMPACGPNGAFPTLPAGAYWTAVDFGGVTPLIPQPKPIPVLITQGPAFQPPQSSP